MSDKNQPFEMKLELILLPVSDIERAKNFYMNKIGFHLDYDNEINGMRLVQLTPQGSGCSIMLGVTLHDMSDMPAGSLKGLLLVVSELEQIIDTFTKRGVVVSHLGDIAGARHVGFKDPDGNSWILQQAIRPS